MLAYKVLTNEQFSALQAGSFAGAPVDIADGYIHLSTAAQLTATSLRAWMAGRDRDGTNSPTGTDPPPVIPLRTGPSVSTVEPEPARQASGDRQP